MKEINVKGKTKTLKKDELRLGYGRVSSYQQVRDGNGLPSQKKRCNEFAKNRGHQIEHFFGDEGVSGGIKDRPQIKALFEYIAKNKSKKITLVCEDMNRLARDMMVYLSLKLDFERKGIKILYVNQEIDDSPQGRIVEQMFMMIAQFFREENKERVISRQKSRVEDGYWCFGIPKGYKWSKNTKGGKRLLLDESTCYIVKEALEKFANYELSTIISVADFLNERGINIGGNKAIGKAYKQQCTTPITTILSNILYSGYMNLPRWGMYQVKGKHKALISLETHKRILRRIEEIRVNKGYVATKMESSETRIDRSEDFPLRGTLYFEGTKYMLSGCWTRGKMGKLYPYYTYPKRSYMRHKVILREDLHNQFEILLEKIQPKEEMICQFKSIIQQKIDEKNRDRGLIATNYTNEMKSTENKIQRYIERIGKTENEYLISNYESELEKLYIEKGKILEKIEEAKKPIQPTKRIDYNLIRNALQLRRNGNLEDKKKLIKNIFSEGIPVNDKKQIQTPKLSLVYEILEAGKVNKCNMVQLIGDNLNLLY